jgi:hypothetical protein
MNCGRFFLRAGSSGDFPKDLCALEPARPDSLILGLEAAMKSAERLGSKIGFDVVQGAGQASQGQREVCPFLCLGGKLFEVALTCGCKWGNSLVFNARRSPVQVDPIPCKPLMLCGKANSESAGGFVFVRNSNQRSLKIQLFGIGLALCLTAKGGTGGASSANSCGP